MSVHWGFSEKVSHLLDGRSVACVFIRRFHEISEPRRGGSLRRGDVARATWRWQFTFYH